MYKSIIIAISTGLLVILTACQRVESERLLSVFEAHDVVPETTTLVIRRLSDNKIWVENEARSKARFIPASTSKIPHTLIALETGQALPDTLFKWDGKSRIFESWNEDLTLTDAYRRSAAWVYQDIVQNLGFNTMNSWLADFNYGNKDIGTVENVTQYWLSGPLEISALEQVEFLTKFVKNDLPLSPKTYATSRTIFKNKQNQSHTLYAKTGWMHDKDVMDIGWFVGWVEVHETLEVYVFAMNMNMPNESDSKKRKPVVMSALRAIGAWPE